MKAVFFDLAGTLITVAGGIGAQYAALAREFGVAADPEAISRAFSDAFRSAGTMVFPHADAPEVASLEKDFWKRVVRGVFVKANLIDGFADDQFNAYFNRLFDDFATSRGWTVFPDVEPALTRLRRARLVVGLVTNFDHRVFSLVESLGLARFLDSITVPSVARAAKPDARIFQYALARHDLRAGDAMLVGDSIQDDVEGGRAAGLRTVLVDRGDAKHSRPGVPGVPVIASLDELWKVLDT